MLSTQQCEEILDIKHIHFETIFTLDCQMNLLEVPCRNLIISLSEHQKRLLICLLNKINKKQDIINVVWYENHPCIRDNNYHQLVYQLRAVLQRNQLPGGILITVPYYGLKLNEALLQNLPVAESSQLDAEQGSLIEEITPESHVSPAKASGCRIYCRRLVSSLIRNWFK